MNNNYILASHDSMTYLKPTKWWMRFFEYFGKCQNVSLIKQYEDYGVRLFDIRIRYSKNRYVFAHGLVEYEFEHGSVLDAFEYLNNKKDCTVRLILEEIHKNRTTTQETRFIDFCEFVKYRFPNIKYMGGNRKHDWHTVYQFKQIDVQESDIDQKVASMTGSKFSNIFPRLMAKMNNKKYYSQGTDKKVLMLDFVNIK